MFSSSENRGGKKEGRVMRSRCTLRPALAHDAYQAILDAVSLFLRLIRGHGTRRIGESLFSFISTRGYRDES